jgi:hypothetical protein
LLRLAENEFDPFITSDQGIRYQQNLTDRRIAIIELSTNKVHRLEAAAGLLRSTVNAIEPSEFLRLKIP